MNLKYNSLTQFIDKNENGEWIVVDKPSHEIIETMTVYYDSLLSGYMDAVAQTKKYDSRLTCALRAGYVGPYQMEGIAFAAWMDQCYAYTYNMISEVKQGIRIFPESNELFISELPLLDW